MFDGDDRALVRPRVKICGITNAADAEAAIDFGADALGFNFYSGSKRFIAVEGAADWIRRLPPEILKVAVLVNPKWEEALAMANLPFIDAVQLHGSEPPEFCRRIADRGIQFAKAIPVAGKQLRGLPDFFTQTIILDSGRAENFGGSGQTFPWEIARDFVEEHRDLRVILAGGLTPENVANAIEVVRPFGVDVTTGVELSPGRKDHGRLRAFIAAAR